MGYLRAVVVKGERRGAACTKGKARVWRRLRGGGRTGLGWAGGWAHEEAWDLPGWALLASPKWVGGPVDERCRGGCMGSAAGSVGGGLACT